MAIVTIDPRAASYPANSVGVQWDRFTKLKWHPCVYVLRLTDGSVYVGWTRRLTTRLTQHSEGRGALVTARYGVHRVEQLHVCKTNEEAIKLELRLTLELSLGGERTFGADWCVLASDGCPIKKRTPYFQWWYDKTR